MASRPAFTSAAILVAAALLGAATVASAAEEAVAPAQPVQVQIEALTPTGPSGVAVLTSAEALTTIQLLVPNTPEGTTATIHGGTCEAVGADLVGLIGQLSAAGQAQASVPIPLADLTDGEHVIALHPGVDFTVQSACGAIPASTVVPPLPDPVDESCTGVPEWIQAAEADLAVLTKLDGELAGIIDANDYVNVVASNIGQASFLIEQMRSRTAPDAASATHQRFIEAVLAGMAAGSDLIRSFGTSDATLYRQAIADARAANTEILGIRGTVAELKLRCPDLGAG